MKTNSSVKSFKFIISIAGVAAINFILNTISHSLGWNLPLDTIGTMLIAMECGYFPGILVAFLTNLFECTLNTTMGYVMVVNVSIAALTTLFYKKNYFKRWYMIALFLVIVAFISGFFEMILVLDSFAGVRDVFFHSHGIIQNGKILYEVVHLRLLYHFLDKGICLALAALIIKATPQSIRILLHNFGWMQRPMTEAQMEKVSGFSTAKKSINERIVIVVLVVCASITIAFLGISQKLFSSVMRDEFYEKASSIARVAAEQIDGDQVDNLLKTGPSTQEYQATVTSLQRVFNGSTDIVDIYAFTVNNNQAITLFHISADVSSHSSLGDVIKNPQIKSTDLEQLLTEKDVTTAEYQDDSGRFATAFVPVYDSYKEPVCYVFVSVNMEKMVARNTNFLFRMVSLGVGFLIVMIAWTLWIAKYHLIYPIDSMVYRIGQFDFSDDAARKKNMEKFRELNIYTGSEIENLYFAFLQVVEESMINFTYFQMKTEQMNRLQMGVIYVLADLVENRDTSTGDHIKKTAAYVEIILRKMKEMGYYEEELNPIFIENCVKSAPLHDVGKIRIPDRILNKPGRLTDEEFEIMKTHAQSGANIIQQIIDTIPDSQYLYEAKRIAGSHHEKWDGSGYPRGLKGEEIPLSARVMAVADVFDALVSVRCYKMALSYDEAMDIVRKDAGTHFDPKVAEAFFAAGDEVKKISDEFANGLRDLGP